MNGTKYPVSCIAQDKIFIPDCLMNHCTLTDFLVLVSELNHIKNNTRSNILFSRSSMTGRQLNIALCNDSELRGKRATKTLLLNWNRFNYGMGQGYEYQLINNSYIMGLNNIFDKTYKNFGLFCKDFDKLCLEICCIEEDELDERRSLCPIVTTKVCFRADSLMGSDSN